MTAKGSTATHCSRCGRPISSGAIYRLSAADGDVIKCFRCSLIHGPLMLRAAKAAFVVGTILTLLNHGDTLFGLPSWNAALAWKVPLTYLVPFCVTLYGALTNART